MGPMEDGLSLFAAALEVALLAVLLNRRDVPRDGAPPPDLSRVARRPAAHVVSAIPLKPTR
jgi:hypothetical protein